jgi:hypothetical protein
MAHPYIARSIVTVCVASAIACAERPPVAPAVEVADAPALAARGDPAGVYTLRFLTEGSHLVVESLPVYQSMGLWAHVTDAAGQPVTRGSVTLQYCAVGNDPAPASECAGGRGKWAYHMSITLNANGDAFGYWGYCTRPRTIGFRFKYSAKGGGVADGTSAARDFTWTATG